MEAGDMASLAKALGHPARVRIVRLLATQERCRGAELFAELDLAQSTVSEHLRILKDAGLVSASAEGTRTVFCLRRDALRALAGSIHDVAAAAPTCGTEGECS